ncbi:LuxR C-terminal-related transcriptional regulator [Rhodocytophaga aerolata]|uniref:LuxR C-terminal-related transcriptional regulator n=1 Tax=Rhodocytophaga aerolata TaxID=455078 RepID=A0ABT8RCV0_9BACT|nr:LuxR C-terminal-related transcriptional regulator [Rhodocytophaga aerolata]MDO1449915.1 LuxR C-terminal-related transcriptional regulator [Rhodocytophaga aerolata]
MLLTKLHIPTPGKNLIHRPDLFEKLNEGLNRKLILISAPAGFGKTTLISDWINQYKIQTAWVSLDKGDIDSVEFLSYMIAGIQRISSEFGQNALRLIKSPDKPNSISISGLLINDMLQIKEDVLLVLDDFHLTDSNEISTIVTFLLEHIPDTIHVAISTRSDPALPLARLRSQHQLVELRSADLRFSAHDISVLFNKKLKIGLSIDDAYALETKTEGWIAGLQLTALSIHDRKNVSEFIQNLRGDNRYIMDYLIEEVLKIQSDGIREFLLQTSIVERFSASLCNAILHRNDSQIIIEQLEKNNLFVIPLDSERKWYRYHHLFADLLKQRLLLKEKPLIEDLHKKAGKWFENKKMYGLAIEHTLVIEDYVKSIQLLEEVVEDMWKNGLHSAISRYGDLIPEDLVKGNPAFCLYYSWILINTGQIQHAEPLLESAQKTTNEKILDKKTNKPEIENYRILLGKIAVAFAHLNSNQGQPDKVLEYCQTAFEKLSKKDPLWLGFAWNAKGNAELHKGNTRQGIEALTIALEYGKTSGNFYLISSAASSLSYQESVFGQYKSAYKRSSDLLTFMKEKGYSEFAKAEWTYAGIYTMMSVTECYWADFDKALESVETAYQLTKDEKNIFQKIIALLAYSYILHAREDKIGAVNKLTELEGVMKHFKISPYIVTTYVGWKIYLFIEASQLEQANDFVKEYGIKTDGIISYQNEHIYINFARLLIVQYKFDEATAVLSKIFALASASGRRETLVQVEILYAILHSMTGFQQKAVKNLLAAMEYAAEEDLINYFLFDLPTTSNLLLEAYKIQATTKTKISKAFVDKLKSAINKKQNRVKILSNFELSNRELDTLKLIADNLTNLEIADKLFVSVNTVKTHLKNIYLKLNVKSRSKAVAKAKEFQLI